MENTNSTPKKEAKRVMHAVKFRDLTIKKISDITPLIRRFTFTGNDLKDFVTMSPEDHVKVFLPPTGKTMLKKPTLGENGLEMEDGTIVRDLTPKNFNPETKELDLEIVLHKKGPLSQWASQAKEGDQLLIAGPRGSMVYPDFDFYTVLADESAIPSLSRRLEEMPATSKLEAFVEIEDESHQVSFKSKGEYKIHWLYRKGREKGTVQPFLDVLSKYKRPTQNEDASLMIISLELGVTKELKEYIEKNNLHPKNWIKATGYWQK